MAETTLGPPATTRDAFYGGRLILEQPATGHRSGTDAVLLAAAVPRDMLGLVYDMGAGVGAVGLGIALTCPGATVALIEKNATYAEIAARNVVANDLSARTEAVRCDLLSRRGRDAQLPRKADLVVTNPPFHRAQHVRVSNDVDRRAAHVMDEGATLGDWLFACLDTLVADGGLIVLHRADRVPELLGCLDRRVGDVTLKPVHPRTGAPATRVLIRARKGSRAPFRLAPPLVLHDDGVFTAEAAALHTGTAPLGW